MTEQTKKIISLMENGHSVLITGSAGTGKTYTMLEVYNHFKEQKNIVLTSTTGINALNLGGITLHKFFGLINRSDLGYIKYMKSCFLFTGIRKRLEKIKYILIDEISMLKADTFKLICEILRQATGILNKPFGGKVILFSGDFYQIPPVIKSYENNKNQWIFQSDEWANGNIHIEQYEKIYRQKDKNFIQFLQNIREGIWNKEMEKIVKQCENNNLSDDVTHFFSMNEECNEWNLKKLKEINSKEVVFIAEVKGKRNKKYANDKISIVRDCIAREQLILKKGARVITIINDPKGEYVNGSTGIIMDFVNEKGKKKCVSVKFDNGKTIKIGTHEWIKTDMNGKRVASMKQIPVILSYALTIHKSQGMTLDQAIVDCKNIFVSGQMYVALSRVKTIEGLKIINFNKNNILVNEDVKKFYDNLKQNS